MAKQVRQFRYYNQSNAQNKNYPADLSLRHLVSGSAFSECPHILQLGIQSLPGTKFYLNNSNNPVIIGTTGIYELDLQNHGYIHSIRFDPTSLAQYTGGTESDRILIDIIYEGGI